jgi:hypothetical protein
MTKIVINECYGGFGLSHKAMKRLAELNGKECYRFMTDLETGRFERVTDDTIYVFCPFYFDAPEFPEHLQSRKDYTSNTDRNQWYTTHILDDLRYERSHPLLIRVVEELGTEANGDCAKLKIVEIPDDVEWSIEEYDGNEWVAETHRRWS